MKVEAKQGLDYGELWQALKKDLVCAVKTGFDHDYHMNPKSENGARFVAYRYALDKMESLEKGEA